MALLQKIKAKLGIGSDPAEREETDPEVTVERESERSDAGDDEDADEAAVEETSAAEDEAEDAGDESESIDDQPIGDEAAEPADDESADETELADETEEAADDEPAAAESEEVADDERDDDAAESGVAVEEIKGIGPAYAERLADIGIETVADLAAADAEAVAEGTSVGEKRAATWIDRAGEF
ncbi:helix-hairpin-helix domain-containing protein [Halorubrum halophilum]|uniref:helix-hairpin-helix domain-containing protein n=1 Tax=Halorubrum halophilum TaxID=413816 RepID=UPI00186B21E4|nr:helix-hairpin-helix domain-containing protein [Halorubrum halophilum]